MARPGFLAQLRFTLERFLVRGPLYKLGVIFAVLLLLSLVGGLLVVEAPATQFEDYGDATWWAFLRLTDPGYLGEDQAPGIAMVSVVLTVLGLAVFVGALVAVLTQWLQATIERLELGLTPITSEDHIAVLGWTNRTVELTAGLVEAGLATRSRPIAILVDRVSPEHIVELRTRLGSEYSDRLIILRSGDPRQLEHLERMNCRAARTVVVTGQEFGSQRSTMRDAETLKVVATLDAHTAGVDRRPTLAIELFDSALAPVAQRAYRGTAHVVPSDEVVARMLSLEVLGPGLSDALTNLLDASTGCTLFSSPAAPFADKTLGEVVRRVDNCIVSGLVRDGQRLTDPEIELRADDVLTGLGPVGTRPRLGAEVSAPDERPRPLPDELRRVLLLGWSGKAPELLERLSRQPYRRYTVDAVALVGVEERGLGLDDVDIDSESIDVHHRCADPADIRVLRRVDLNAYDRVLLLADQDLASSEAADARTIATLLMLQELGGPDVPRRTVVELLDPSNVAMAQQRGTAAICTPDRLAHVLAGWVAYPDLAEASRQLRGEWSAATTIPLGEAGAGGRTFGELAAHARARGDQALGIYRADTREPMLAPPRDQVMLLAPTDHLIVNRAVAGPRARRADPAQPTDPARFAPVAPR